MIDWFPEHWTRIRLGDNALVEWIVAVAVTLLVAAFSRAIQAVVTGRLSRPTHKTFVRIDNVLVSVLRGTSPVFHLALGILVAKDLVRVPASATGVVHVVLTLVFTLQFGSWATRAANGVISVWATGRDQGHEATRAAGLGFLARLLIWTVVVLIALANFGIEPSAVIAGLGVGGVAAALAVQSTLGDLFAGVSMYFDRPFDIGDFVGVDALRGTVTKIGIKTTRIQSIDGEELVLPNGEIAKARIRNFARMRERRILFRFGIEYAQPAAKVERAVEIVREVIGRREGLRLDRVHFVALGQWSLEFEVVYFVLSPDYVTYLDHQQAINLDLYRAFEQERIGFAFPTQTVITRDVVSARSEQIQP
jgi:small-conductance mechanosensitive channel